MKVNPSKENDWILSVNTVMHLGIHQIVVGFSIQNSNQNSQRTRGVVITNVVSTTRLMLQLKQLILFFSNPMALLKDFTTYLQEKRGHESLNEAAGQDQDKPTALLSKFAGFLADSNPENSQGPYYKEDDW
eukprot:XP_019074345.1 PREDICTED: uncharacterized protein LOC109122288 [Vitis vinifera]